MIKDTQAENLSDAIRLIVTERMIRDEKAGKIEPFLYAPAPTPRDRRIKRSRTIKTGDLTTFPLGEPPAIAGPLPAPLRGDVSDPKTTVEIEQDPARYWNGGGVKSELSDDVLEAMKKERGELSKYAKKY